MRVCLTVLVMWLSSDVSQLENRLQQKRGKVARNHMPVLLCAAGHGHTLCLLWLCCASDGRGRPRAGEPGGGEGRARGQSTEDVSGFSWRVSFGNQLWQYSGSLAWPDPRARVWPRETSTHSTVNSKSMTAKARHASHMLVTCHALSREGKEVRD